MAAEVLRAVARRLDVDESIATTLAARGWQFLAGPVTVWMITRYFSPTAQGFFYGFEGVLATQAFFELGLGGVIVSLAGHESAVIRGEARGDAERARRRLASLVAGCNRWFGFMAVAFWAFAAIFGWLLFNDKSEPSVQWRSPWMVLVPIAAASLWCAPRIAILEGSGFREQVYRVRLWQAVTGTLAVWTTLMLGGELWAAVVASGVQLAWSLFLIGGVGGAFFAGIRGERLAHGRGSSGGDDPGHGIAWRREVAPMQWRIALQSVAFHVATQLLTLIVFHYHDPIAAGRLGLTMKLLVMLQAISSAWLQTRYPVLCGMAADHRVREIDRMWRGITWVSSAVFVAGTGILCAGIVALRFLWPEIAERFTTPLECLGIAGGMLAIHLVNAEGYYVIAFRRPPLLLASLAGLAVVGGAVWAAGADSGLAGLSLAYAAAALGVLLPLHTLAFVREHRRIREASTKLSPPLTALAD